MSHFIRLLTEADKAESLAAVCTQVRMGEPDSRYFDVAAEAFDAVPGKPFAYWVRSTIREIFSVSPGLKASGCELSIGASTKDDFRYLRCWWEGMGVACARLATFDNGWVLFCKGGAFSAFYADPHLLISWKSDGIELKADISEYRGSRGWGYQWSAALNGHSSYFRPGLTWPRRTNGLSFRVMPAGCIFADKGPAAFVADDDPEELFALCAVLNSRAFGLLVSVQLARTELAQSYEVGLIQQTPVPTLVADDRSRLAALARRAWSLKRTLDTVTETSHAFLLPTVLRDRLGDYDPPAIEEELTHIQAEIDAIAFDLYGFSDEDRAAARGGAGSAVGEDAPEPDADDEADENDGAPVVQTADHRLSWAVGVAFGRFDWRLATGQRTLPSEPDPFDALPAKSPGMLPDGAPPFHAHAGILVDDPGHPHDLGRLVEEVLSRVDAPVPPDVRRWLQRDFFPFHLQHYSKSRRKAPIYWPLATTSGSYTLWLYYPSLTGETLYIAINDFLDPKLKEVGRDATALRDKGTARSRDDEKRFDALQTLELELTELRDALLKLAPTYKPNHDDGVQITASPLWPLFRHKPWQRLIKDTWAKLEKGDYDWAHLAMNYWPERVREKCRHDKSLAIAHDLEALYVEPEGQPAKTRGRKP